MFHSTGRSTNRPLSRRGILWTPQEARAFCTRCARTFVSKAALDSVCVRVPRFIVSFVLSQHNDAKHPSTYDCSQCQRSFASFTSLKEHWRGSPSHPNCAFCGTGCKDNQAYQDVGLSLVSSFFPLLNILVSIWKRRIHHRIPLVMQRSKYMQV